MSSSPHLQRSAAYPARFIVTEQGTNRHGDRIEQLGAALLRADPLADDVVDGFAELAPGVGLKLLEQALATGIRSVPDAPAPLRALFEQLDHVPSWVDFRALDRGGAVLLRAGALAGMVLGLKSLIHGYAAPGGNKPLVFSGRFQEQAGRRLGETTRFVHTVSRAGGVRRYAEGFAITVKVRLMHAQVRRLIWRSGRWQKELWGEPINQHDMMATTLLFSIAMLDGLGTLGYAVPRETGEDVIHLWRYVGYLMGVEESLLPTSMTGAWLAADLIRMTQGTPDDDARALTDALLMYGIRSAKTESARRAAERRAAVIGGLCRVLLGEELADQLAVPKSPWTHAVPALRPVLSATARVHRIPLLRNWAVGLGEGYWRTATEVSLDGAPATFTPPARMAGAPAAVAATRRAAGDRAASQRGRFSYRISGL